MKDKRSIFDMLNYFYFSDYKSQKEKENFRKNTFSRNQLKIGIIMKKVRENPIGKRKSIVTGENKAQLINNLLIESPPNPLSIE